MSLLIFDIEADGLLDTITKIHCVVFKEYGTDTIHTFTEKFDEITDLVVEHDGLVGHNIIDYDLRVLQRFIPSFSFDILNSTICQQKQIIVDTLLDSKWLYVDRPLPKGCPKTFAGRPVGSHSLAAWAYRLDGKKPEIEDWQGLPLHVYVDRCIEDVLTTEKVFTALLDEMRVL